MTVTELSPDEQAKMREMRDLYGFELVHEIRKTIKWMDVKAATYWLEFRYPELVEYHKILLRTMPDQIPTSRKNYDVHRRLFIAAAWLCGASQSQLGKMFNVAQQTVLRQLDRVLPQATRMAQRLAPPPIDQEHLDVMKEWYYAALDHDEHMFESYVPIQLAITMMRALDVSSQAPSEEPTVEPESPPMGDPDDENDAYGPAPKIKLPRPIPEGGRSTLPTDQSTLPTP